MIADRRTLMRGALLGGATLAASPLPRPAIAQGRIEWRMATSWPRGLPGPGTGAERLAERIGALSDGRLTVRVFSAGELVPPFEVFDAVAGGTAELGHDAPHYNVAKSPAAAFYTSCPFGLTAAEHNAWLKYGGGQAAWDALYEPFGIKPFVAGNSGTQMFGWFRREITAVEDLRGLKFRTVGNLANVLSRLGVTIVGLPPGEIFTNLQSGAIDAAEWVGPYNDLTFGFHQVAPYYYGPGWPDPGAALELIVNRDAFEALPADLKAVVETAAHWANEDIHAEFTARSGPALRTLVEDHGVQLRELPEPVVAAMAEASSEMILELLDTVDPLSKAAIESYLDFRDAVAPWTRFGEYAALAARLRAGPVGRRR